MFLISPSSCMLQLNDTSVLPYTEKLLCVPGDTHIGDVGQA